MSQERPVTRAQLAAAQDPRSAATMPAEFAAAPVFLHDQELPEARLTADERDFRQAHKGRFPPTPILMSRTNPYRRKLEDLLRLLQVARTLLGKIR